MHLDRYNFVKVRGKHFVVHSVRGHTSFVNCVQHLSSIKVFHLTQSYHYSKYGKVLSILAQHYLRMDS